MFTLIKREIHDTKIYLILILILTLILVSVEVFLAYHLYSINGGLMVISFNNRFLIIMTIIMLILITGMGVSQMHVDRSKKISSFLSTFATTRDHVFLAKISAGILAILLFFVSQIITISIIYKYFVSPAFAFENSIIDVFITGSLVAMSCYCIGLHTGWKIDRQIPFLGVLPCIFLFISIISIKGFGTQTYFLLILFIAAYLIRIRQNYISTSL